MATPEDVVTLTRGAGASAVVHLYGATLISWQCDGEERIFVSSKSLFDNKKAIRGGIPIAFPQFGPWQLGPQHGFARIQRWWPKIYPTKTPEGDIEATFILVDNEETRKMWNYRFQLTYRVVLRETSLTTTLTIHNTDAEPFTFTCLLHTYLKVPDVTAVTLSGLQGIKYIDKLKDNETFTEERELVKVAESVDRVYIGTGNEHKITKTAGNRSIILSKTNFPETVIWNPWKEKAAAMSDFGNDDYPSMICVEAGLIRKPRTLPAKESVTVSQTFSV